MGSVGRPAVARRAGGWQGSEATEHRKRAVLAEWQRILEQRGNPGGYIGPIEGVENDVNLPAGAEMNLTLGAIWESVTGVP